MTEKEKAAAGLLYDANYDPQILKERARAQDLCLDYNLTRSSTGGRASAPAARAARRVP